MAEVPDSDAFLCVIVATKMMLFDIVQDDFLSISQKVFQKHHDELVNHISRIYDVFGIDNMKMFHWTMRFRIFFERDWFDFHLPAKIVQWIQLEKTIPPKGMSC